MKKMNNNGFSLIEILVSLAIAGIVIVGTYTIMSSSANSYRKSNSDIDVQQEAETTSNFIYELLIEATDVRVTAANTSDGSCMTVVIKNNTYITDNVSGKKTATAQYNFVVYDNNNNKMYYKKVSGVDDDGNNIEYTNEFVNNSVTDIIDDTKLLAEDVSEFTMTPNKLKAGKPMTYSITINDNTASYNSSNAVYTRNHIEDETAVATVAPTTAP